ncbi:hypothetical protein V8E52_011530 [Russula decolorans]
MHHLFFLSRKVSVMCQPKPVAAMVTVMVSCGIAAAAAAAASAADGAQRKHWQTIPAPRPPSAPSHSHVEAQYLHVDATTASVAATGPFTLVCCERVRRTPRLHTITTLAGEVISLVHWQAVEKSLLEMKRPQRGI